MLITVYVMLITSRDPITHKQVSHPIRYDEHHVATMWHSKFACLRDKWALRLDKGASSSCVEVQVPLSTATFRD